MKFYKYKNSNDNYLNEIYFNKLTAIYADDLGVDFFKHGVGHNAKNASK